MAFSNSEKNPNFSKKYHLFIWNTDGWQQNAKKVIQYP